MPESPNATAIAKHARALERLRVLRETLEAAVSLLGESDTYDAGSPGRLGVQLLERERDRLEGTIADLE